MRCAHNILQVLYHELTHNVHSDHDNDFKNFMSQLIKDGDSLDWSLHGGRVSRNYY